VRVAIIGGSGKMGRWFASFLLKDGKEVVITGRNESKLLDAKRELGVEVATNAEAVKQADVILVSVPIDNFEPVVQELQPYINPKQVVIDITSIKVFPVEIMHKYIKTGLTLGTHPMFGPGAKSMAKQNFILTPTNEEERALAQRVREYLLVRGARVTLMTPQEHDEMMAVILGLSHFIAIVSADTLLSLGGLKQRDTISGTTYKLLLTLVESVLSEDPDFYAALQMSLPNMTKIEELFQRSSKTWAELVESKDRRQFVHRMNILRDKLKKDNPDLGKAYQNMYKILEGL
jgi:prephenate dehydrogenase